ncbi:MAG: GAF domain-containing protein [Proteobacteria bacterium]|nr:GAF domain-containing protein [Pseudomonadota bacterium]
MRPLTLKKALRGAQKRVLTDAIALVPGGVCIADASGKVLVGEANAGEPCPIVVDDEELGSAIGGPGTEAIASLAAWIFTRETEKRALAGETLERYKELSLLYELGEQLSRQLDVEGVARTVVEHAQRHLGATGTALFLHDPRRDVLEAVAGVGEELDERRVLSASTGTAGRVLRTGRAEFVDEVTASGDEGPREVICAPMRVGERVFGMLRLWQDGQGGWGSGHLKLVAALAANASSALAAAQLQGERLRELSLLHQLERHVSPDLLGAVFEHGVPEEEALVVACCDLRRLATAKGFGQVDHLVQALEQGVASVIDAFLEGDAVVDTPQGMLVLGVFRGDSAVDDAVAAGRRVIDAVIAASPMAMGAGVPGVGVACATVRGGDPGGLYTGINNAAVLQSESDGQLLVDQQVARALAEGVEYAGVGVRELPGGPSEVFEVQR